MLHLSTKHLNNDDLARLQAPGRTNFLPVPSLPGVPNNSPNPGNCPSCGNDYAEGARFCRDCGLAKPSQAALVSMRNEVPRSEIKRNVSFGPTSVSDLSAAAQALPNAPPRLIARLQELELDSLLALCERLEGRLSKPKRSNRIKASEAELDDLCESLADPDAMPSPQIRQQQQQQQQLRYLTQLREAKQAAAEGFAPPPTSTTRPILRSDAHAPGMHAPTPSPSPSTQAPSTSVGTSAEPPDGQKSIPASKQEVLDALLLELNELLEKAPSQSHVGQAPAASPGGPSPCGSPTPKPEAPEPSPKPAKAGAIANSAGPLPVEEQVKPAKPSAAFLDTVSMLQDGLRTLVERFSDEVAQASAELKAENERLLAEIAELRMQPRDPVTILSAQHRMEESPAEAILGPAVSEAEPTPMAMATRMQPDLAVRFQPEERIDIPGGPPEQAPECPDVEAPEGEGREASGAGSLPTFAARSQWVQELQAGQADWGENAEEFEKATRPLRCSCVCLHELSRKRMLWDLLGLLLLIYDLVMTPWQVAFGQVGTVSEVMTWVLPVYWAINIFMTLFCTSFSSGGVLHSNRKAMVWRYLTQGFLLLDLLTTLLDLAVLTTFYDLPQSAYQSLRSLVLNKDVYLAIQAARLLRSIRVSRNLLGVRARIRSELWRALGTMAFSTLLLLLGAHIIACALYYLGSATGGNENTWLLEYAQIQQQEDSISMYLSALLWALAQLTPGLGPSPVNPKSVPDMILSTTVHVLALLACICLFAQGGMLVMRLRDARGEWANRQLACRAYLNTCGKVPQRLQCHILSWLEFEPEPRKALAPGPRFLGWCGPRSLDAQPWHPWLPSENRSPLALLPPLVQQELLQELAAPFLSLHPFFHELDVAHPQALRQVIDCFQQFFYSPMQPIFRALTVASKLHMVTRGSATYSLDPASRAGASKRLSRAPVKVKLGQHISEGGLWLEAWQHQGILTADGIEDASCEVLVLDEQSFGHLLRRSPGELWQAAASYARAYAKRAGERVTLTDLDGDLESLVKITDEAFADALRYLAQEAEQDPAGEAIGWALLAWVRLAAQSGRLVELITAFRLHIVNCFESLNEAFATSLQKQKEQHARLRDMQQATAGIDKKLSALQQELAQLKAMVAKRSRAAASATPGANSPTPPPSDVPSTIDSERASQAAQEEGADAVQVKKVYTNAGITFSRELLLACLEAPSSSMDIRLLPCLEELARELGRPAPSNCNQSQTSSSSSNSDWHWSLWRGNWYYWQAAWHAPPAEAAAVVNPGTGLKEQAPKVDAPAATQVAKEKERAKEPKKDEKAAASTEPKAKENPRRMSGSQQGGKEEKRIDPADGKAYTFNQISKFYRGVYSKHDIQTYWDRSCKSLSQ
ncbi:Kcnh6 [Symbiodinium sp. CCMP2592]|nr:Kcnh6 [Symbiodinium sp. CCMP2592]